MGQDFFDVQRFLAAYRGVTQGDIGDRGRKSTLSQRLRVVESVPSTNQWAWELMAAQEGLEPIAIAAVQTAGRGQWGRQWCSEPGGLYLSVGLHLDLAVAQAAQLTLATVWGIATALRTVPARLSGVETGIPVQIKWLNDLVLHGRKLGGILTETRVQQGRITKAVIGVGINWTNPVPETGINLQTMLAAHPMPLIESLELLAAIAVHGIFTGVAHQQQGQIDTILAGYWDLLAHRDRPVMWDGSAWAIVGIAPTGELRIQPQVTEKPTKSQGNVVSLTEILIQPGTISLGYPL